jgi:hypothetical protein
MPVDDSDFIQDGTVTEYGADGQISKVQKLNPHQLATHETTVKVLDWLAANISQGNPWTALDLHIEMTNSHTTYNCPCYMAVAANGQQFNAGELDWNLFNYATPTASVVEELNRLAGPATS